MENALMTIENLTVHYDEKNPAALEKFCLQVPRKGGMGIMGESGSGKTTLAMAIMGLLGSGVRLEGEITYDAMSLLSLPEEAKKQYRWRRIAILFQNSLEILNPVLTIGEQIRECILRHCDVSPMAAAKKTEELLERVGLEPERQAFYPHQLSGGIRQRVLLAMALSCEPELLILDEPTNSQDAETKQSVIRLLEELQKEKGFAMLVISHEPETIARLTSRLTVLYRGRIVEEGMTQEVFRNPRHPYTRGLLHSSPDFSPFRDLWGIPGGEEGQKGGLGCLFYERCMQGEKQCSFSCPELRAVGPEHRVACHRQGIVTVLQGRGLRKSYHVNGHSRMVCADCSLEVKAGEVVALIGQSGSGKTTLVSMLAGMLEPDEGTVLFQGKGIQGQKAMGRKNGVQLVFQDSCSAVNEQFTVEAAVGEPLRILRLGTADEQQVQVEKALASVQLPSNPEFRTRKCHTLSGGQRQRVALARALIMEPAVMIADEISAMLDPSTQANVLRLLKNLQNTRGFAMIYITHDLAIARKIADRVYVMQEGRLVEKGNAREIFSRPSHSYTRKLVEAGLSSSY